jgi:voltage-gated sodium channel
MSRITWAVFVIEMVIKIIAEGDRPWVYFNPYVDPWNLFDFFCIVCASPSFTELCGISLGGLRMLRIVKFMYSLKDTQAVSGVVKGFFGAIASCKFLLPIWLLIVYIWAMLGVQTFGDNDPDRFGSFQAACMSLYVFSTFDALSDAMYANMYGSKYFPPTRETDWKGLKNDPRFWQAFLYFFSYCLLTSLILLSAFLGVVQIAMDEEQERIDEKNRTSSEIARFVQYKAKGRAQREQVHSLIRTFELMDLDGSNDVAQDEIQICKLASLQQMNPVCNKCVCV